jgi:hypothetical protein
MSSLLVHNLLKSKTPQGRGWILGMWRTIDGVHAQGDVLCESIGLGSAQVVCGCSSSDGML